MRTKEQTEQAIEEKLGFIPPYFKPAQNNLQILENLWQQTLSGYLNNALPHLLKEKLFAYLSRYCTNSYWLVCQSCILYSLGIKSKKILELLSQPAPTTTDVEQHLKKLAEQPKLLTNVPESNSQLEQTLLVCGSFIFLHPDQSQSYYQELRRLLEESYYQNLITFLSYIKTCHYWLEAHPEITPQSDPRVRNYLSFLVKDEPKLDKIFNHYYERVRQESIHREQQLLAEIVEYKQKEEKAQLLQTMTQEITESQDFHSALQITLSKVCEVAGWNFGEAWIPDVNETLLNCSPAWYASHSHLRHFREVSETFDFPFDVGLPGRVWASKQIEWDRDVSALPKTIYLRAEMAKQAGLKTGFGLPLIVTEKVVAVLVFYMFEAREKDEQVVELISTLMTLGATIQRKRAEEALQKALDALENQVQQRTLELRKANAQLTSEIQERKQAQKSLKRRERELKALVENAPDIIARFNPQMRYVYVNPAIETITDLSCQFCMGKTNEELNLPQDFGQTLQQKLQKVFQTKQENEFEFSFSTNDGTKHYYTRLVPELGHDGSVESVLSIAREISALKEAEAKLIHDALHDPLTGLPNRVLFIERLSRALVRTNRDPDYRFAVLFLDLDRFKIVNDSLGHAVGDLLLIAIGERLETCLRSQDTVARFGGDEFVILLDNIANVNEATAITQRIQTALLSPFNLQGYEVFTNASIGIALSSSNYNQPEELLRDADIAMYRAKNLGKARYEIFNVQMYAQAKELLPLETNLRRAIERQEFVLDYQPIVSLETNQIIGFEALVRWLRPKQGLLTPDRFIPLAEETGLIVPIGNWVLEEACRQLQLWQTQFSTAPPLTMSVNFSSKQFLQPNLIEQMAQILQATGLKPNSLKLEMTESVLMDNSQSITAILLQLGEMGIQIQIDDFGTGYSSLSYLHRFPSNALKIDRSFVSTMGNELENLEIVKTIIRLADGLKIDAIAEGVETAEQVSQLKKLKCQYAQGYFFSPPMRAEAVSALLETHLR